MTRNRLLTAALTATLTLGALAAGAPGWSQPARGAAPATPVPTGKAATVKVSGGQVQGILFGDVAVYRGLPYAAPPVGNLRWRAPQSVVGWQGVRDASVYGKACTPPPDGSEDCLFLNVYAPAGAKPGAKLPVMFWIHGGGFTGGTGASADGTPFVKQGVVFVSINYRMGRAGWFAHPAITKNAPKGESVDNFGLQDQLAALRWVQANIGAFGGDRSNVTVFGESAGGVSDLYLVSVEPSRGLIHKMISQSGFGLYPAFTAEQAERAGAAYFAGKGLTGDSAATLEAMRNIPWSGLQERMAVGETQPIIDGKLVKMDTGTTFSQGKELKIPILLGGNSFEASLWRTADPAARLRRLPALPVEYSEGGADPARIVNRLVTDLYIGEGDREMARWHTQHGSPTFRYYFSYVPPSQRAGSQGLAHGGELGYVFGRNNADPQDAATSQATLAYWTAFAKYGNPGAAGGPAWPKYDLATEAVMEFSSAGPVVRNHMFDARYDWIRDHRDAINATADQGVAPVMTTNPAHEGPRNYVIPGKAGRGA